MKKLILTKVVYDLPDKTELVTKQHLVVINSDRNSNPASDLAEAVTAAENYYQKHLTPYPGARIISVSAEPTIDAENPDPQELYTEAELVRFGNFMVAKCIAMLGAPTPEQLQRIPVLDSDIQNWKEEERKSNGGRTTKWNPRSEHPDTDRLVECRYTKIDQLNFFARVKWDGRGIEWFNEQGIRIRDAVQFEWTEIKK